MHPPMGGQPGCAGGASGGGAAAAAAATASTAHPHQHYLHHQPALHNGGFDVAGDAVMVRWLQSAGLQHLAAPLTAAALDHRLLPNLLVQDYARYGVQSLEDKQKLFKLIKSISTGSLPPSEFATPPALSSSTKLSNMDGFLSPELRGDFGPGILDLHAIDTELLSEAAVPGWFESCSPFVPIVERGFENDFEAGVGKQCNTGRSQGYAVESTSSRSVAKDNGPARIKVVVRKRPINKKELTRKEEDIISVEDYGCSLTVHEPKLKVDLTAYVEKHEFVFDAVLDDNVSNDEVYRVTVEPIVPTIFQRTKATCIAYGQTGSGKTYTMQPLPLKASQDILHLMQQPNYRNQGYQLWLSFFEIYGGKLFDLLNERSKLCMREDGRQQVCIVGLKEFQILDLELLKDYIEKGNASRSTGSTGANEESSRSHAILQLSIKKIPDGNESKPARIVGKLSFIDLAGSERGADTTENDRQTRLEGAEINKSLLALKECIRALDSDQGHIPFRGSKLTEVLRDSFVGGSRTVMISCISPNTGSCEHTLNTLRYADRVKGLSRNSNSKKDLASSIPSQRDSCASPLAPLSYIPQMLDHIDELSLSEDVRQTSWQNHRDDRTGHSFPTIDYGTHLGRDDHRSALPVMSDVREHGGGVLGSARAAVPAGGYQENQEQDKLHIVLPSPRKATREGRSERQLNVHSKEEMQERRPKDFRVTYSSHSSSADVDLTQLGGDGQISALLKEEDELVSAHRKEVEDTIEIVREEMKLLAEVDQPGSQIVRYVSQLNHILSKKAVGLVNLQARLARFQHLLKEQEVLSHSTGL